VVEGGTREHAGHPAAPASRTEVFEGRIRERVISVLQAAQLGLVFDGVAVARQHGSSVEAIDM